jgi:eukaryotic-like serine/threonine-protein kinase
MNSTSELDEFVLKIERCGLLFPEQLRPLVERLAQSVEPLTPEAFAKRLQAEQLLTSYQARQLLTNPTPLIFLNEKYKILEQIGEGGMGRVYLCEHMFLEKLVAVKLLTQGSDPIPGAVERFMREGSAAAALDHPNIARVFDSDYSADGPFLVMEYVDGINLHQLAAIQGPLEIPRAAQYISQAAKGLQHAHERGLIHRDVKPGNLMVDRSGVVKLLDLGLVRFFDRQRNKNITVKFDANNILGTAEFIAPEQAMNSSQVDIRADIYALGCTFYFLLLARFPFSEGSASDKLRMHVQDEFEPVEKLRPEVPRGLITVLSKMVRKDPDERYTTPAEVVEALAPWTTRPVSPLPNNILPAESLLKLRLGICPPPIRQATINSDANTPSRGTPDVPTPNSPRRGMPKKSVSAETAPASSNRLRRSTRETVDEDRAASPIVIKQVQKLEPRPTAIPWYRRRAILLASFLCLMVLGISTGISLRNRTTKPTQPIEVVVTPVTLPTQNPTENLPLLRGAGSTFASPLMQRLGQESQKKTQQRLEYSSIGSSRGIRQMIEGSVDFCATDAPLTAEETRSANNILGEIVFVPIALGAVVPTYYLPNVEKPLNFNGPILADIFEGNITFWDDPEIAALNPGVKLPHMAITIVQRADGSGTTYLWTSYLSATDISWRVRPGTSSTPDWPKVPGSLSVKGNEEMAETVRHTPGSLGYVELTIAKQYGLAFGQVRNKQGKFVAANIASVSEAISSQAASLPPDLRMNFVDAPGDKSYPIVGVTWVALYRKQKPDKAEQLKKLLGWMATEGVQYAEPLDYVPVPKTLQPKILEMISKIGS